MMEGEDTGWLSDLEKKGLHQRQGSFRIKGSTEGEDLSSNRPEVVTLWEYLETHPDNENLLYLTDNEDTLQDINKWIGGGAKLSLAKTTDTDILRVIVIKLQERV
jgi:TusA-related sulfurtransferase